MTDATLNGAAKPVRALPLNVRRFSPLVDLVDQVTSERPWHFVGAIEGSPLVVFVAPEKGGKSWACIQLAVAAATGGKWLGAFQCARPGPAVYLDAENGPHEFARRFARVCRGMGLEPRDVAPRVLHYYSRDLSLDHEDEAARWLLRQARDIKPSLVVVDPWRNHKPGEENNAEDTLLALDVLAQIRDASGATIVIPHHLNKAGGYSGSRALLTRADLIFEGTDEEQAVYSAKGRTIRRADPITRRFAILVAHDDDDDDAIARTRVGLRFEGDAVAKAQLTGTALRVLAALKRAGAPMTSGDVKRATSMTNGSLVAKALGELRSAGAVAKTRDGKKWTVETGEFFASLDPKDGGADGPY